MIRLLPVIGLLACGGPPTFHPSPDPALAELPFSEAVQVGRTLFLAGQIGNAPGTLALARAHNGESQMAAEAKQTMANIGAILKRRGLEFKDIVKCTVFLADMSEWSDFNNVYATYFDGRYPARSAMGVNGLALGARVEVECLAVVP